MIWIINGGKGFTARLRQALLDLDDPELLFAFPRSSFILANDADYNRIEASAKEIGLLDQEP
ncbi:MAG: hypothetical protein AABY47_10520 [Pseudomonadota bacterium]